MRRAVEGFFYVMVGLFTACILWKLVSQDTTTLVTLSESDAVKQAGDRSLEMAKWTIATVLTVGGLLLGANWLQSAREREELRESTQAVEALKQSVSSQIAEMDIRLEEIGDIGSESRIDLVTINARFAMSFKDLTKIE